MTQNHPHNHSCGHSHGHSHNHAGGRSHNYFSEVHADRESQFFGKEHNISDTEEMIHLRRCLIEDPDNYELLIELADKLNYQLRYRESVELYNQALEIRPKDYNALRKRAPRYYNTLQFEKAYEDYASCNRLSPDNPDILYRFGITAYAMGRNGEAETLFSRCLAHYTREPEMLVASAYWLALSSIRTGSGNKEWKEFDFTLEISHHTGYRDGLKVLCEKADPEQVYQNTIASRDALNGSIVLYGLAVYYRHTGEKERAREMYAKLMEMDEFWAGFVYIAAWAEKSLNELSE